MASKLWSSLNLNNSSFINGLNQAAKATDKFSATIASSVTKNVKSPFDSASKAVNNFSVTAGSGLKEVSRIVQGILISQFFYRTVDAAQQAAAAVLDMSKAVEDATVAFTMMFKSSSMAKEYIKVIEDFAAVTPYTFQEATDAAKKLLAMGIPAENSLNILRAITDAASLSGEPQSLERISRAIGQINTRGKLAQQEMLQLTEAGIPAFEILQEKLGLTRDQLGEIGKLAIPADVAIKAIITGMNERYGGASDVMSRTMSGLLSTIKDNLLIIGKEAFDPLYQRLKSFVAAFADGLNTIRSLVRAGGIGGLFESLIPKDMQGLLRQFVAYFKIVIGQLINILATFKPYIQEFAKLFLNALNLVMPAIIIFNQALYTLLNALSSTTPFVRALVTAIGGLLITSVVIKAIAGFTAALRSMFIVKLITSMVLGLAQAVRILAITMVKSPIVLILGLVGAGLAVAAYNSERFRNSILNLTGALSKAFGVDTSKIFKPKTEENTKATTDFNKELGKSSDKLDDMGDAAKKAAKKAKDALFSFDEVFSLNEKDDDTDTGFDLDDIITAPIPEIDTSDFEIPSFDSLTKNIAEAFKGSLMKNFKNAAIGAGIGAVLGAIIGSFLGNPILGAQIGAVAGALVGWFWEDLKEKFGPAATSAFNYIHGILSDKFGWIIDYIKNDVDWSGAFDGLKRVVQAYVDWFKSSFNAVIEVLKGVYDFVVGVFTGDWDRAWDGIKQVIKGVSDYLSGTWEALKEIIYGLIDFIDSTFGPAFGDSWEAIKNTILDLITLVDRVIQDVKMILTGFIEFITGVFTGDWDKAWDGIKMILSGFKDLVDDILQGVKDLLDNLWDYLDATFKPKWGTSWDGIKQIVEGVFMGLSNAVDTIKKVFDGLVDFVLGVFTGDWKRAWDGVKQIFAGFRDGVNGTLDSLETIIKGLATYIDSIFTKMWGNSWTNIKNMFRAEIEGIVGVWNGLRQIFNGLTEFIAGVFTGDWRRAWDGVLNVFKGIFGGITSIAKTPINGLIDMLNTLIGGLNKIDVNLPGGKNLKVDIPRIPRLAKGGLVTKNTIAELSEGNRQEAVMPLENPTTMGRIANAILDGMNSRQLAMAGAGSNNQVTDERPIVYVQYLIADDRGLTELERRLEVVRVKEGGRRT